MNIQKRNFQPEELNILFKQGRDDGFNQNDVLCFLTLILNKYPNIDFVAIRIKLFSYMWGYKNNDPEIVQRFQMVKTSPYLRGLGPI